MHHREEGRFTIRIELGAEFDEAYEGDDDGYAWLRSWQEEMRPRLARAVFDVLRDGGRFDAIPASRGGNPDENLEIDVRLRLAPGSGAKARLLPIPPFEGGKS